jgi:hypothetical protein
MALDIFLNVIRSLTQNHLLIRTMLCVWVPVLPPCTATSNDDDRAFTVRIDIIVRR